MARCHLVGIIVHLVDKNEDSNGFFGDKAICGANPSNRGYGWIESENFEVSCKKCLKKM